MCCSIMRQLAQPMACAASTYKLSLAERTAERIEVTLADGTVTLKGSVRSWAERRAALGSAGHAPGVRTVVDRLFVAD